VERGGINMGESRVKFGWGPKLRFAVQRGEKGVQRITRDASEWIFVGGGARRYVGQTCVIEDIFVLAG